MKSTETWHWCWTITQWAARVLTVLVFLFWGGFFVEHLNQWFISPYPRTPPMSVWAGQVLHLLMLVGLLVSLRWPLPGLTIVAASALAFFGPLAGSRFPLFFGLTILPPLLLLLCGWRLRRLSIP